MSKSNTTHRFYTLAVTCAALLCVPLASCQQAPTTGSKSTTTMQKMDVDKDKQVTKEEYMKYQEKRFDTMDKTKDKKLSQDEWEAAQLQKGSEGEGE